MLSCFCVSLCVWTGCTDVPCLLWLSVSPPTPQGQPCHSSLPWRPGRGKCRQQQSAGRFKPRKVAVSFPLHFLVFSSLWPLSFSLFLLLHPFFAYVSMSPSLLLLTSCSYHPSAGFNTITDSIKLIPRHINFTVNTSSPCPTHTSTGHGHTHCVGGMSPPFASAAVANPPFYDPDYK